MIFDVAIVGASVAGSSLALRLARQGIAVALLDRDTFPRRKACGEGLSDIGVSELELLGLGETLRTLPHRSFRGYEIRGKRYHTPLLADGDSTKGIGIERYHLDAALFFAACDAGATAFLPVNVRTIARDSNGIFLISDRETMVAARYLVVASGPSAGYIKSLQLPLRAPVVDTNEVRSAPRHGWNVSLSGEYHQAADRVVILRNAGHQIFFTAVGENRLNIAVTIDQQRILLTKEEQKAFSAVRAASPMGPTDRNLRYLEALAEEIVGFTGQIVGNPLGAPSFQSQALRAHGDHFILIGDAAETMDPIGGMGMSHALISSRLAADALMSAITSGTPASHFARYAHRRENAARLLRGFTWMTLQSVRRLGDTKLFSMVGQSSIGTAVLSAAQRPRDDDGLLPKSIRRITSFAGHYISH